jgi:hypothetical protein
VDQLLKSPEAAGEIGLAARRRIAQAYSWSAHLSGLDQHLARFAAEAVAA